MLATHGCFYLIVQDKSQPIHPVVSITWSAINLSVNDNMAVPELFCFSEDVDPKRVDQRNFYAGSHVHDSAVIGNEKATSFKRDGAFTSVVLPFFES